MALYFHFRFDKKSLKPTMRHVLTTVSCIFLLNLVVASAQYYDQAEDYGDEDMMNDVSKSGWENVYRSYPFTLFLTVTSSS